jgi:hypothetical protein
MKTKCGIAALAVTVLGWNFSPAQDLMEMINDATKQYNEQRGIENEEAGERSPKQKAQEAKWKKQWEDAKAAAGEGNGYFDSQELNCLFLMVLYLDGYFKLEDEAEAASGCLQYDLYGTQVSAIALSTTIMYCPEHLYNLSDAELQDFVENQLAPLLDAHHSGLDLPNNIVKWIEIYLRVGKRLSSLYNSQAPNPNENPDGYDAHKNRPGWKAIRDLTYFFSPPYVVRKSLELGRKMEATGCDNY